MNPAALEARAHLFAQFAAMDDAGIPPATVCATVAGKDDSPLAQAARRAARALAGGSDLATAGRRAGLFTAFDAALIDAYAQVGGLTRLFNRLAARYATAAVRLRQVRNRLLPAAALIVLAAIVAPLPAVVSGALGSGAYLARVLLTLSAIVALLAALVRVPRWLHGPLAGTRTAAALQAMTLRLPLFGPLYQRRQALAFVDALALLLDGGMPAAAAIPAAARTVSSAAMRADFEAAAAPVAAGQSLAAALDGCAWLDTEVQTLFYSGEGAGRLAATLLHYADAERARLGKAEDALATWAPRAVYLLVLIWLAGRFV